MTEFQTARPPVCSRSVTRWRRWKQRKSRLGIPSWFSGREAWALNAKKCDVVETIRELTGGGADIVFECAGGSPKQGLAGTHTLTQAIDSVRSGGKIVGVSWFGAPLEIDVDTL